jgi:hypothetical protein
VMTAPRRRRISNLGPILHAWRLAQRLRRDFCCAATRRLPAKPRSGSSPARRGKWIDAERRDVGGESQGDCLNQSSRGSPPSRRSLSSGRALRGPVGRTSPARDRLRSRHFEIARSRSDRVGGGRVSLKPSGISKTRPNPAEKKHQHSRESRTQSEPPKRVSAWTEKKFPAPCGTHQIIPS